MSQRILHLFSRGKKARLDNFVVFPGKKIQAKNGRKMAYFSLDCRCNPELPAKSATPGVGQNRGKTNFFFKKKTSHVITWALPTTSIKFQLHSCPGLVRTPDQNLPKIEKNSPMRFAEQANNRRTSAGRISANTAPF